MSHLRFGIASLPWAGALEPTNSLSEIDMRANGVKEIIPSSLYRTVVAIVDHGSITNAARELHVSQAAISSQVKRLERMLGGAIFDRSGSGVKLTKRGSIVLEYARRMLMLNDQLLDYAGPNPNPRQCSIGLPRWLRHEKLVEVFKTCAAHAGGENLRFSCDHGTAQLKELGAGLLDIAFICETNNAPVPAVVEWSESLCWVAARGFAPPADAPIPLIHWPGRLTDRYAISFFEATGTRFAVPFSSADATARVAAAEAGLGYLMVNSRAVTPALDVVHVPFLPAAPTVRSGIYVRPDLDRRRYAPLIHALEVALKPPDFAARAMESLAKVASLPRR
jgi:DNA-binding transcriptional LysR family regulator